MPRYVKFMQGTPEAFAKLPRKDSDTLYVIYENDEINATLYLGSRVIAGGEIDSSLKLVSLLSELKDIQLNNKIIANDDFLVYDIGLGKWVNKSMNDLTFVAASNNAPGFAGFVPAPGVEDNDKFLSSNGEWKSIVMPEIKEYDANNIYFNSNLLTNYEIGNIKLDDNGSAEIAAAGKSIAEVFEMIFGGEKIVNDEIVVATPIDEYGYFGEYAAAVEAAGNAGAVGEVDTHNYYGEVLTVVNDAANLYVVQPDNSLSQIAMTKDIPELPDTYTKTEIDNKVAAANHLKRKMINTVEEIGLYAEVNKDAEQYIFMVPTGLTLTDNRYDEYMIIPVIDEDGVEIQAIERVGTWEIDLGDYVKKTEIETLMQRIESLENRLAALENNNQGQT